MATKTYDELLASGTLAEINAQIAANTKRVDELFQASAKRQDGAATTEELMEIETLDAQSEALDAKAKSIKKVEDIKNRNTQRKAALNDPVHNVPFNGGNGGGETKDDGIPPSVSVLTRSSVKNFKGETRAEAELKAYRAGQWLLATQFNVNGSQQKAVQYCRDHGIEMKAAQGEDETSTGGAIVFPEFEATLIDLREEYGVFRRNISATPMKGDVKSIPRRTGGVTAYFVGEGASITTSNKTFDVVKLTARKIAALVPYSTEISEDAAINIADDLAREIAYAFALLEDQCGFIGDGTSTYGGIRGVTRALTPGVSATLASVAGIKVQTGTASFSGALLADFQGTIGKLPLYAGRNPKWYMHNTFYNNVPAALSTAAGGNTVQHIAQGPSRNMLLGYPVEFSQVLPFTWVANTIFALFGDLSLAAKLGDRRQTTLFTDPYSLTATDQIQIRGTERFDIVVHDVGNGTTPGPIVAFASASS